MSFSGDNVKSEQLGHLGLVASVIHDLGIIDKIDARIELNESKGGIVSYGRRVAAMVLNGLGFMNSRLCMTAHFFEDKPVAKLLGDEVNADNLNDDCLGRCLDKIAKYGTTKLYAELAFEIAKEQGILGQRLHLDSTSFTLQGRYDVEVADDAPTPTYGYSKAHRPDLKQVMMSLVQGGEANIPLWMESLDGNSSDKKSFQETVRRVNAFMKGLHQNSEKLCFVVDSAFFVPEKLAELDEVFWITRVPAQLKEVKTWLKQTQSTLNWQRLDEQNRACGKTVTIHGIPQRWLMIESKQAIERESKTLQRKLDRLSEELIKKLWHLGNQLFQCQEDAKRAALAIQKTLKYHQIHFDMTPVWKHTGRGRPCADATKLLAGYRVEACLASDLHKINRERQTLGRFVLASNQLDMELLTNPMMLRQYKEQSCVEAGFKFIKNDSFELDSFYLKTPARIGALMMVMTLCLMVYNFAQYHMRKCIKENNEVLPNQVGKPIQNPTLKWIAELMNMIAVVTITTEHQKHRVITNLKKVHQRIIAYFGPSALDMYDLPPELTYVDIDHSKYKNINHWCERSVFFIIDV